jgi:hypothetical protein
MRRVFALTDTTKDLLDAHSAHLTLTSSVRTILRPFYIGLGLLWASSPLFLLEAEGWRQGFRLLMFPVGCFIVWQNLIHPWWQRRQIKRLPAEAQLKIAFFDNRIKILNEDGSAHERSLSEVASLHLAKRGLLFVFTDGSINWLPRRVFANHTEMKQFAEFIEQRLQEIDEQSNAQS